MPTENPLCHRATAKDAFTIAAIKAAAWPDEPSLDPSYYARVLKEPDHITLVAEVNDRVLGFVDGFLTLAADGARRWEIDLVAVHPVGRRRGLGQALVEACMKSGFENGASYARALIRVDNIASQCTFTRCGFHQEKERCQLYITMSGEDDGSSAPSDTHLIPVMTLNYCGLWVEGVRSSAAMQAASSIRARHEWDIAGAVIALLDDDALCAARVNGYKYAGDYAWWRASDSVH